MTKKMTWILALLTGLLALLAGCQDSLPVQGHSAPAQAISDNSAVVAILDDASMSNAPSLARANDALLPLFRSVCQHHWTVGLFRATAQENNPLQWSGTPQKAESLMETQRATCRPSAQNGTDLYSPMAAMKEWLSQPEYGSRPKYLLLITDGQSDPTKIDGQTRRRYRNLYDVDLGGLNQLHVEVIGVEAGDAARIRANWPTACVHIKGTEAEAVTPRHLGLPEYEDEIL
jgi:hypothetical protein